LLPIVLVGAVVYAQNRFEPREVLFAHRPISPDALRANVAVADAETPSAPGALSRATARTTASATTDAPSIEREREQNAARLVDEAIAALRDEHNGEAYASATACLQREPGEPECLRVAAVTAMRLGHYDEARPIIDRCLQQRPDETQCLAASAQLALRDRDLTLAGITSWRLMQLAPNSADTLVTRAQLAELQGDMPAATRSYRAACERGQPFACRRLGELVSASSVQ
jgi:Tfp pilus assembly protein PilF